MKHKTSGRRLPKANNGLQQIQAKNAQKKALITQGISTAAEVALPGIGGAAVAGINALSSLTKDANGLYKSKAAQVLDTLNPVTQVSRVANGIGKVFKGDFKGLNDLDGQQEIKDALAKEKQEKEAAAYYGTLGADTQSTNQLQQFKKGANRVAAKIIEMEGGEPHFSKKANGRRVLKQYHPHGPTHEQGGIVTLAEEGDAIVTAKKGLGAKAVAAHKAGDHQTVEKLIAQMPEDTPQKKKAGGVRRSKAAPKPTFTPAPNPAVIPDAHLLSSVNLQRPTTLPMVGASASPAAWGNPVVNDVFAKAPRTAPTNPAWSQAPATQAAKSTSGGKLVNVATGALQAGASIYNVGQGLFGNVEKTARRELNPELLRYEDNSQPTRRASKAAMHAQVANARNLSAGSAGNARVNANQAFADDYNRQAALDSQEAGRKQQVQATNTQLKNDAQARNAQMHDQADNLDLQNQAKKSEALAKGLEGIGALAANSVLQKNTLAKEAGDRDMLSQLYKNFTLDANGKAIYKKLRKGTKKIKK